MIKRSKDRNLCLKGDRQMQLIFLSLLTLAVLLLAGGYYTFASAAVSAVLLVYLAARMITSGTFRIRRSLLTLALFVFCLMHFLVYFWAVDPSMAFKGGVKFLPVFFLWLALGFLEPDQKEKWLGLFPFLWGCSHLDLHGYDPVSCRKGTGPDRRPAWRNLPVSQYLCHLSACLCSDRTIQGVRAL